MTDLRKSGVAEVRTGSSNRTVRLSADGARVCKRCGGPLRTVHHYGPDGRDYGPTGFLECVACMVDTWNEPAGHGWEWEDE